MGVKVISRNELNRRMLQCGGVSPDDAENAAVLELLERVEELENRNEELQRRVERLEIGIQSAIEYWNRSETDGAMVDALFTIEERLEKALDAADAEEK